MADYFRNDRQFDEYQVEGLQRHYNVMNESFMNDKYGEAVNYARALIESTCKYVYHELTGKELEEDKGRKVKTGEYMIGLSSMINQCLKTLQSLMTHSEDMNDISSNIGNIVTIIGNVRNSSALSHGSRHRNIPVQKAEARYIISISEDVCMLMMDLLYERTFPREENCIGSIINPEGLHKYDNAYQEEGNPVMNARFETYGQIIHDITLSFKPPINEKVDSEFIDEHVHDYLPDDVGEMREIGLKKYQYYSDRQDKKYQVELEDLEENGVTIYISGIETK